MLLGIGIDIISITRVKNAIETSGKVFLNKIFTPWEQQHAESHPNQITYFARTFAAKEAIFKCFGSGWEAGEQFTEIEIQEGEFGEPIPILRGNFARLAQERGVTRVLLSLSHETEYVVANAALIRDNGPSK